MLYLQQEVICRVNTSVSVGFRGWQVNIVLSFTSTRGKDRCGAIRASDVGQVSLSALTLGFPLPETINARDYIIRADFLPHVFDSRTLQRFLSAQFPSHFTLFNATLQGSDRVTQADRW